MDWLSALGLADLAGTTAEEIQRLVDLGILITDGAGRFRTSDVQRVRLLAACERAGLPVQGIAAAVGEGRLSLDFLEAAPYRRWAVSWNRWGSPGWRPTSRSGMTSWSASSRCCSWRIHFREPAGAVLAALE